MFDRNRLDDQNYQFLDMFEHSIGVVTDRESRLFSRFNRASEQSAQWLRRHTSRSALNIGYEQLDKDTADQFLDALLDIGVETSLLAEIKDIRDELNIIMGILESQLQIITYLEGSVMDEVRGGGSRRTTDAVVSDIKRRTGEQKRGLEAKQKDVSRMDRQASSLYEGLTDLLDLKQKHSNALEARFAGDQAVIAAKQGQTIMVFTIVTIVFLPLSFIASFFAINFVEWENGTHLSIPYVSKYLFGIGFAISIPLVALAFTVQGISNAVVKLFSRTKAMFGGQFGFVRGRRSRATRHDEDTRLKINPNVDLLTLRTNFTREKAGEIPKPSFSSRREDYYQSPTSSPVGNWNSNPYDHGDGSKAWMRPSFHNRERSDEHRGHSHGRLSPVSAAGRRRRAGSGNATGNAITWAARPSAEHGAAPSGARPRGLSQDLESGRF